MFGTRCFLQLAGVHVLGETINGKVDDFGLRLDSAVGSEGRFARYRAGTSELRLFGRGGIATGDGVRNRGLLLVDRSAYSHWLVEHRTEHASLHATWVVVGLRWVEGGDAGFEVFVIGLASLRGRFIFMSKIVNIEWGFFHRHVSSVVGLFEDTTG